MVPRASGSMAMGWWVQWIRSVYTIKITDYKHKALPASTFTFDKSQVPAGTQVVDLR